jgi:hypothetical protein
MEVAMQKVLQEALKLVLLACAGVCGSIIVGLMVYGTEVFSPHGVGFSFVSFGVSGACIFAFYHVRGLSETITAAVVVSALQFVFSLSWVTLANAAIWSFGINLSIILVAFLFERKLAPFKRLRFVAVAAFYGAMFVLLTLCVALVNGEGLLPGSVFRQNFFDGLLIGLGLGLGIQGGEAFIDSLKQQSQRPVPPLQSLP